MEGFSVGGFFSDPTRPWGVAGLIIILLSPLVGLAIFSKTKWGFGLFLAYSVVLLGYHLPFFTSWPSTSTTVIVLTDVALAVCVTVMLSKDMRTPYLAPEDRGWRIDKRYSCYVPVRVEARGASSSAHILNISVGGALIVGKEFQPKIGETILVTVDLADQQTTFSTVVERITAAGAGCGVSFQNLDVTTREALIERVKATTESPAKA
jgi:hypothetical protein